MFTNNFEKITRTKKRNSYVSNPRRKKTQPRGGSQKRNWKEAR